MSAPVVISTQHPAQPTIVKQSNPANPIVMASQTQSAPPTADIWIGYNPGTWRSDAPFHAYQCHGEIIFVKKWRTGEDPNAPKFLTLGQLNLVLREAWNKYQTALSKDPGTDRKRQTVKREADKVKQDGEDYFLDDPQKIYGDHFAGLEEQKFLMFLSKLSILDNFRLFGVRATNDANGASMLKNIAFSTRVKGRENVVNYWKNAKMGHMLYLILKREQLPDRSWGCFQYVPWSGECSPTVTDTEYYDDAGLYHCGAVLQVGQVIAKPKQDPSDSSRNNYSGLSRDCSIEGMFKDASNALRLFMHVAI